MGGLFALVVLCLFKQIQLAIAIDQVAAEFVSDTPQIILLPLVQFALAVSWCAVWIFLAAYLISQVPGDYVPNGCFNDGPWGGWDHNCAIR